MFPLKTRHASSKKHKWLSLSIVWCICTAAIATLLVIINDQSTNLINLLLFLSLILSKQDKFPSSVCGYLIIPSEDESFGMINSSKSYQIFGKVNSLSIREHRDAKTQHLGFLLDLSLGLDLARQHFHNNAHLNCGYSYTRKALWTSELKPCYWNLELLLDKIISIVCDSTAVTKL